jgi:hypothetical protein
MLAFLPLVLRAPRNDNGVMHPFQMDTLAKQRWDELVTQGSAARHNACRRRQSGIEHRRRLSALLRLVLRRPVGRTPGRDRGACEVLTLP